MLSQKIRKMGTAKKHCKTQDILMVGGLSWGYVAHLGAMLAYLEGNVGLSWGYVGPSWGYVGPSWGYVGPSWGYVGPSWGHVGPSWPFLTPMLAHVDPSCATSSEKGEKMRRAQNTVKRGGFWLDRVGRRQGARPLSPTERRETPSARTRPGGPWPDLSAYARQPARGPTMLAHLVVICWPMLASC